MKQAKLKRLSARAIRQRKKPASPCTDVNGERDGRGRFATGNKCARGNPLNNRTAEWRAALTAEVTVADIRRVIRAMLRAACAGDVAAAKVVLERTLGRVPLDPDAIDPALNVYQADDF